MRHLMIPVCAVLALGVPAMAPAESPRRIVVGEEQIVSVSRIRDLVDVRNITVRDRVVSGTIINSSDKTLRDVRLQIRHQWLWNNEFHPGTDDPGRTEFHTLPGEIPSGARAEFTYRMDSLLPERSDGRFQTQVEVVSLTAVDQRPVATAPY
jgi:hypothetical protein